MSPHPAATGRGRVGVVEQAYLSLQGCCMLLQGQPASKAVWLVCFAAAAVAVASWLLHGASARICGPTGVHFVSVIFVQVSSSSHSYSSKPNAIEMENNSVNQTG